MAVFICNKALLVAKFEPSTLRYEKSILYNYRFIFFRSLSAQTGAGIGTANPRALLHADTVAVVSSAQTKQPLWTEKDRQFLLEGLQSSQNNLLDELKGLTETQIHCKPDSTKWSIAE